MSFKNLLYIYTVYEFKSMILAAKHLNVSTFLISKSINESEDLLGFEVFERSNKGMYLTEKGKKFICELIPVIQEYNKISDKYSNSVVNDFVIASNYMNLCMEFVYKHIPNLDFNTNSLNCIKYKNMSVEKIFSELENNSIDIGVLSITNLEYSYLKSVFNLNNFNIDMVSEGTLHIRTSKYSKLYNKDYVTPKDLEDMTFVKLKDIFFDSNYVYKNELELLGIYSNTSLFVNNFQEMSLMLNVPNSFAIGANFKTIFWGDNNLKNIYLKNDYVKLYHIIVYKSKSYLTEIICDEVKKYMKNNLLENY